MLRHLMTPFELGILAREYSDDPEYVVSEIGRQARLWRNLEDEQFRHAMKEDPRSSDNWNALIEGVVAYVCSQRVLQEPLWTYKTVLLERWQPVGEPVDEYSTPRELLAKNVVLSWDRL